MPVALAVKVTGVAQLLLMPSGLGARVQLAGVMLLVAAGLLLKLTVPVGALLVPLAASVTVAVQALGLLAGTVAGEQLTLVLVVRAWTVTVVVPLLVVWTSVGAGL